LVRGIRPLPEVVVAPEVAALLPRVSVLAGAGPAMLDAVGKGAERTEGDAGVVLLRQGDAADEVLLLSSGSCDVTGTDGAGG
ncbi:hypothetical protein LLE87_37510, partial [Paenibacillus polymyxa]|nr:hypothetical protein [Paenibacillus polymyxa]